MAKKDDIQVNLGWMANELESARGTDANGKAVYTDLEIEELAMMLAASQHLASVDLSEEEKYQVAIDSLFAVAQRGGTITSARLRGTLASLRSSFLKKPAEKYVLLTSLTLKRNTSISTVRISGNTLFWKGVR